MPWCHKCKNEYNDGVLNCADCDGELENDSPRDQESMELEHLNKKNIERAHLTCVMTDIEADMIMAKLKVAGIPSIKLYRAGGDYFKVYVGETRAGVDIYVPEDMLGSARDILSISGVNDNEALAVTMDSDDEVGSGNSGVLAGILLGIAALLILLFIFTKTGI